VFERIKDRFSKITSHPSRAAIRWLVRDELKRLLEERSIREARSDALMHLVRDSVREELLQLSRDGGPVIAPGADLQDMRLETIGRIDDCRQEMVRLQLTSRLQLTQALWKVKPPSKCPHLQPSPHNFQDTLNSLKALHPHLYDTWERINFVENPEEFARRPEGSCTIGKRHTDEPFSGFVAPYLRGRVLDVGCGPYAVPLYLQEYPVELIYGIDPVVPFEPHPFTFVRAIAESIPFPDRAFDVVIAATSLDHSLSLERALAEIRRVIRPGGSFLVWDGFVKGSPRYNPSDPSLVPVDAFHFFHFDEGWFEETMDEFEFEIDEKLVYDPSPHNPQYCASYFYSLTALPR
jgi:SAM-dependent methyltransferase